MSYLIKLVSEHNRLPPVVWGKTVDWKRGNRQGWRISSRARNKKGWFPVTDPPLGPMWGAFFPWALNWKRPHSDPSLVISPPIRVYRIKPHTYLEPKTTLWVPRNLKFPAQMSELTSRSSVGQNSQGWTIPLVGQLTLHCHIPGHNCRSSIILHLNLAFQVVMKIIYLSR
jgi:hypothetical protein